MRSEALDIILESRRGALWLVLSGPFHNEQAPNIREKILDLLKDGNRRIVIHLEGVDEIGDGVVPMFLSVLNTVRGKGGDLTFIFKNTAVSRAFGSTRNLFTVFPDEQAFARGGFLGTLRLQGKILSRKTGIRLSRPVALFVLFVLCGWFLSLAFIIHLQNRRIHEQEQTITELSQWKARTSTEITRLRERLKPMEQLGILDDSSSEDDDEQR